MTDTPAGPVGPGFDDHLAARLLHQRIVVLGTEVDDMVANRITAELLLLSAEDPRTDISLYINSPGGVMPAGLAIYDTMQLIPNDVSTVAVGFAAGTGQVLLCAGAPGKRFSLPHAQIMMHQPSAGVSGTAVDIEIQAENLEFSKKLMLQITASHTGQRLETVVADADRGRWFTADQAREYGMIDRIVDTVGDIRPAAVGRKVGL